MSAVQGLIDHLKLRETGAKLYEGNSVDIGSPAVFGGQVLAQALDAASYTVPADRLVHSLHAYFILPGDINAPIEYAVDVTRDGRSFSTRRVSAVQHGRDIFVLAASFQIEEEGFDHQIEMLNVPPPESLASYADLAKQYEHLLKRKPIWLLSKDAPIDFRPVELINPMQPGKRPAFRHVWFRSNGKLNDDKRLHRYLLAYVSDFNLLVTALLPHDVGYYANPKLQLASLDHAIWFHRDFRMDDWLLYAIDSPSASNARGFCRGNIFSKDGRLVASVTQEGLMRMRDKKVL